MDFLPVTHVRIRDFDHFSNFADFSRKIGKSYPKTVFTIVFSVFELTKAAYVLNHIGPKILEKSIFSMSAIPKFDIFVTLSTTSNL